MALSIKDKKAIVAELNEVAAKSYTAIASEYRGMTVEELTNLRVKARKASVYLRVVKNTLARKAFEDTGFACMGEQLKGPLIYAFSSEDPDPGAAARVIKDFAKENDKLIVKAVAAGGQLLTPNDLEYVAKLPTREQALGMLMNVINAPSVQLARTLNEAPSQMARIIAALRDKQEETA